jgi:16S rRNA (guanine527-N7)-methyltransferase
VNDVSRETAERLTSYALRLREWNSRINLVSRTSLEELEARHFADSLQLFALAPHPVTHWVDLGSGGGFPGLVIAIRAMECGSPARVTLIESDQRKAAFLRTVIRETGAPAVVLCNRIESASPQQADVVSARALSDLTGLLGYAERHLADGGTCLFSKGATWQNELGTAAAQWQFDLQTAKSLTDPDAVILQIKGIARV